MFSRSYRRIIVTVKQWDSQKLGKGMGELISIQLGRSLNVKRRMVDIIRNERQQPRGRL
jgi:hypothetical protein